MDNLAEPCSILSVDEAAASRRSVPRGCTSVTWGLRPYGLCGLIPAGRTSRDCHQQDRRDQGDGGNDEQGSDQPSQCRHLSPRRRLDRHLRTGIRVHPHRGPVPVVHKPVDLLLSRPRALHRPEIHLCGCLGGFRGRRTRSHQRESAWVWTGSRRSRSSAGGPDSSGTRRRRGLSGRR
jgi:hypothetical protein